MTRLSLIALLTLTACARPDCATPTRAEVERCLIQPDAARCICDRPMATLPAIERERGDTPRTMPDRPDPETPEPPKPEPEGPKHPGKEPPREAGEVAHDAWKDARDRWKEAGGQWP